MMKDKEMKPIEEDKGTQNESKLTQSSSINITPPKQESAQTSATTHPSNQIQPNNNVIEPPKSAIGGAINIKRSKKEETPEFLKGPPKKKGYLEKRKRAWFIETLMILSIAVLVCSVTLVLFCIKEMPMPKFIQPAIDYSYKFAQTNFGQNESSLSTQLPEEGMENDSKPMESSKTEIAPEPPEQN